MREACGRKNPRVASVRLLSKDGKATPTVLAFLREAKVGEMVSLTPSEVEEGEALEVSELRPQEEAEEDRPGPP